VPEGTSTLPRAPIAIGAGALLVVLVLLTSVFVAMRGGGDDTVTARPSAQKSSTAASSPATPTGSASATAPTAAASAPATTKRPPTLNLMMAGTSFVTVRLPNGSTVVSKLYRKGQHKSFDQKELRVLLGNSAAVQVTVNGKLRKPGRKGQVATFTARRK
jgi:cytoskeletal protein RodZ